MTDLAYGQVWRKQGSLYMAIGPVRGRSRAWHMLLIGRLDPFWGDVKPLFRMGQSEHVALGDKRGWELVDDWSAKEWK